MAFKLFIDSDVVIDFFTDREPHVNAASELFDLNERKEVILYLSAVSINNIYYIVRRFLGHKKTLEVIQMLTEMTEIVGTTQKEILQALKNSFSDYEDSVQYSSALAELRATALHGGQARPAGRIGRVPGFGLTL